MKRLTGDKLCCAEDCVAQLSTRNWSSGLLETDWAHVQVMTRLYDSQLYGTLPYNREYRCSRSHKSRSPLPTIVRHTTQSNVFKLLQKQGGTIRGTIGGLPSTTPASSTPATSTLALHHSHPRFPGASPPACATRTGTIQRFTIPHGSYTHGISFELLSSRGVSRANRRCPVII